MGQCVQIKEVFLYSAVSSPQDCSECFTLYTFLYTSLTSSSKHHLKFSGKHPAILQLMHEGCLYKYPPMYIARYLFIQLSKLEEDIQDNW